MKILKFVRSDSGFTLIEAILSLFTLAFILSFLPMLIKFFHTDDVIYDLDYDLFVIELMETYQDSEAVSTNSGQSMINFTTKSKNVSYRLNNNRVIKSIDGTGFITMLFNVDAFIITESEHSIQLEIIGGQIGNETYSFKK
ncbi:ComGF family competence protein [Aliicoccus persicus]|uniref:Competence protein ComGF n=1 Tax=Aliicoccus persicus TaxID=930138 RepID=A0A662Z331_9STAP|nr:ComGF family competence protein [Aliicoccus persicus]SEV84577.1 Competence protein ComGF [Aliicoccus persicus]